MQMKKVRSDPQFWKRDGRLVSGADRPSALGIRARVGHHAEQARQALAPSEWGRVTVQVGRGALHDQADVPNSAVRTEMRRRTCRSALSALC
jgi:hypothetical protein